MESVFFGEQNGKYAIGRLCVLRCFGTVRMVSVFLEVIDLSEDRVAVDFDTAEVMFAIGSIVCGERSKAGDGVENAQHELWAMGIHAAREHGTAECIVSGPRKRDIPKKSEVHETALETNPPPKRFARYLR